MRAGKQSLLVITGLLCIFLVGCVGGGRPPAANDVPAAFKTPSNREWRLIGPGISGCMAEIAFHPTDPRIIYSGGDQGAAFKTTDGGLSWKMLGGASPSNRNPADFGLYFRGIAVAPDNPDVVWFSSCNAYKSEDGGKTISQIDVSACFPPFVGIYDTLKSVHIDPTDGDIVYLLKSELRRMRPRHADGALARTLDGGKTWKTVVKWPTNDPHFWSTLVIDRYSPVVKGQGHQRLYLCGLEHLLRSDDGGASWNEIMGDLPKGLVKDLVVIPQAGGRTVLFVICLAKDAKKGPSGYVYRSDDNGKSWQQKMNGVDIYHSSYDNNFHIANSPADPGTLYYAAGQCRVYRSRNLGDSWEIICQINDASVSVKISSSVFGGADVSFAVPYKDGDSYVQHFVLPAKGGNCRHNQYSMALTIHPSLAVSPSDPKVIAFIQGTMIATTNGGATWSDICSDLGAPFATHRWPGADYGPSDHTHLMRSRGVQVIESRQAAFDPFDPDHTIAAAYLDIGLRISRDGGAWWEWAYDKSCMNAGSMGKAYSVIYDPTVKGRLYVGSGKNGLPDIFRSDDSGRSFTRLHIAPLWDKMRKMKEETGVLHYPDVQRIVIDPSSPADKRTLYAGIKLWSAPLCGVYKSEDGGAIWREASNGMGSAAIVHELIINEKHPQTLYAAAYSGDINGLFKTTNGGELWMKVAPDQIGGITAGGISLCAAQPDTVYAVACPPGKVESNGKRTLFRSDDGGATWRALRTAYINSVAVNPVNPDWLYITQPHHPKDYEGTGTIFRSKDGGKTWEAIDDGVIPENAIHSTTPIEIDRCDPRRLIYYSSNGLWIGFDPEAPCVAAK